MPATLDRVDPQARRMQPEPGCGLGLYATMLLVMGGLGVLGMVMGSIGMLAQLGDVNPKAHTAGSNVSPARLQPLRDAGLLGAEEVPGGWHDESADLSGDPACALLLDRVVRIDGADARSLPYGDVAAVELLAPGAGVEVVLMTARPGSGRSDIACRFGPDEGAIQMMRQVQVEVLRLERGG